MKKDEYPTYGAFSGWTQELPVLMSETHRHDYRERVLLFDAVPVGSRMRLTETYAKLQELREKLRKEQRDLELYQLIDSAFTMLNLFMEFTEEHKRVVRMARLADRDGVQLHEVVDVTIHIVQKKNRFFASYVVPKTIKHGAGEAPLVSTLQGRGGTALEAIQKLVRKTNNKEALQACLCSWEAEHS